MLVSLVLALPAPDAQAAEDGDAVLPSPASPDAGSGIKERGALLSELRAMGAHADLLIGQGFFAAVPQMASASRVGASR